MHRLKSIRLAALLAASLILANCATPSVPPAEDPAPAAVDPRICKAPKPEPLTEGSIVQPATTEEATETGRHLQSDAASRMWGREGWDIAALGRKRLCPPPDS